MTAEWLLLLTGAGVGWWVGRWMTERGIARFTMGRVWRGRKDWRRRK